MLFKRTFCSMLLLAVVLACAYGVNYTPERVCASVSLKTPGNSAERYALSFRDSENPLYKYQLISSEKMPLLIYQDVDQAEKSCRVTVFIVALENVYFHFDEQVKTGYDTMTACSICPASGIVAICVHPNKLLLFIHRIVGWYGKTA